jgi:hypothetical protein
MAKTSIKMQITDQAESTPQGIEIGSKGGRHEQQFQVWQERMELARVDRDERVGNDGGSGGCAERRYRNHSEFCHACREDQTSSH